MKCLHRFTRPLLIVFFTLPFYITGCNSEDADAINSTTGIDDTALIDALNDLPLDDLSAAETDGLLFMREEEKLARDVYIYLFAQWDLKIFDNISNSEQTHTDAILTLLDRYNINDPVGDNAEGVFVNTSLQDLYDALLASGSASLIDALLVGAAIEEIDIIDIQNLVDALEGNEDLALVYDFLIKGSYNHLRAFVSNLENQGVTYQPQYLSQDVYDAIINADF